MQEDDKHKSPRGSKTSLAEIDSEYSYLDYLIEKKFYKRYWKILRITLGVLSAFLVILAFFGISRYQDLTTLLREAEIANVKLQTVYQEHLVQDSLKGIRQENSKYYAYHLQHNGPFIRESISKMFQYYGFGFPNHKIEDSLSWYLYERSYWYNNAAYHYIKEKEKQRSNLTCIGVVYNGMPDDMISRIDSIFKKIYPDTEIEYFHDANLPESGFLYYIYSD